MKLGQPASPSSPLKFVVFWVLAFVVVQQVGLIVASLIAGTKLYPVFEGILGFGHDHRVYYFAAELFLEGVNPYKHPRFVTPPPSLLLGLPLSWAGLETARVLYFGAQGVCLAIGVYVICRRFGLTRYVLGFVILSFLFYPVQFLLERGNADGVVVLLMALACGYLSRPAVGGAALALAIGIKIYPAALLLPALLQRHYKLIGVVLVLLLALVILTPELWLEFLERGSERARRFKESENRLNGSVFVALRHVVLLGQDLLRLPASARLGGLPIDPSLSVILGFGYYLFHFIGCIRADVRGRTIGKQAEGQGAARGADRGVIAKYLFYLPFMMTVPFVSYHYVYAGFVLLLPVLCWCLGREAGFRWTGPGWLVAGVCLLFVQPAMWVNLTGIEAFTALPNFGMMIMMRWVMLFKQQNPRLGGEA